MPDSTPFHRLARQLDPHSRLLRVWPLTGGYSADVTAFEIEHADRRREKFVVRRHGEADLTANPNIAADEFTLLATLQSAGLPVPPPVLVDADSFPTPVIVVGFVDGVSEFAPPDPVVFAVALAEWLARIHRLSPPSVNLAFLPDHAAQVAARLSALPAAADADLREPEIRAVLSSAWPWQPRNRPVLLHGDFWPGNLLWRDARLAAIIDWEDAALGDPLADVGNTRLEVLWAFGDAAMHAFTRRYRQLQSSLDYANQPYWDVFAALRPAAALPTWGLDLSTERTMRTRLAAFTASALAALP